MRELLLRIIIAQEKLNETPRLTRAAPFSFGENGHTDDAMSSYYFTRGTGGVWEWEQALTVVEVRERERRKQLNQVCSSLMRLCSHCCPLPLCPYVTLPRHYLPLTLPTLFPCMDYMYIHISSLAISPCQFPRRMART